jgi:hypothetical protein
VDSKTTRMAAQAAGIHEVEEHEASRCIETRSMYVLLAYVFRHFGLARIGRCVPFNSALHIGGPFCISDCLK